MKYLHVISLVLLICCSGVYAADKPATDKAESKKAAPEGKVATSQHKIKINGKTIKYTATAGTLLMKNDKGEPIALFGFTAYTKDGSDKRKRPITFAYNGGPGSASVWLHMGILGPQRAIVKDADFYPNSGFKRVANEYSILDETDLVMVDPVGTGFSRPVGKATGKDFWGTDQDIKSVSSFIKQYISDNQRWQSPKFILGESYGGMRTAGVSQALLQHYNMSLNGIILVSPFLEFTTGFDLGHADLPHILFLPTFAATAWYHDALTEKAPSLTEFLSEVEAFSINEYALALLKGNNLTGEEKSAMAKKLSHYTGLKESYLLAANLRVNHQAFTKELLRERQQTVGRIDSRFKGEQLQPHSESMNYDPMISAIGPPVVATFMDYYATDLKVEQDVEYKVSGNIWAEWDWGHRQPDVGFFKVPFPDTSPDLEYAMKMSPNMKVLIQQGYFDLATPHFTTKFMIDHLKISDDLRNNIRIDYYEAGHMMYIHQESMVKYKQDLATFIRDNH
ncbi:carboxypeptidase [Thalassotalea sp. 42_200_T64]|nr:carboxypeptidase [Thalassotalea sp. 42_200_T64]